MFGLSIDGPGRRTAEPVPDEITRNPALLQGRGVNTSMLFQDAFWRHTLKHCELPLIGSLENGKPVEEMRHRVLSPDCLRRQRRIAFLVSFSESGAVLPAVKTAEFVRPLAELVAQTGRPGRLECTMIR